MPHFCNVTEKNLPVSHIWIILYQIGSQNVVHRLFKEAFLVLIPISKIS